MMGRQPQPELAYAGFWLRVVAQFIDGIVFLIVLLPIMLVIGFAKIIGMFTGSLAGMVVRTSMSILLISVVLPMVLSFAYYTFMESSPLQATLGKLAIGIKVTDLDGNRVGIGQAFSGLFCLHGPADIVRILGLFTVLPAMSALTTLTGLYTLISCISAGFTEQKQGIHDSLSGCLVVKK